MYFWGLMGATEVIFIFAVYLLLFGAKGIPSLAKTMGQAVRTFRNATEDIQREILDAAVNRVAIGGKPRLHPQQL